MLEIGKTVCIFANFPVQNSKPLFAVFSQQYMQIKIGIKRSLCFDFVNW